MTKITVMRGLSGSGKSTLARTLDGHVVSRDSIRAMLTGRTDKFAGDRDFENAVSKVQQASIEALVRAGQNVIVDDTNIQARYVNNWFNLASEWGAEAEVVALDVDVETCIQRAVGVPEKVIRQQAKRYNPHLTFEQVTFKPYVADTSLPPAIGVDLDGTLALFEGQRGPYDHHLYHTDKVNDNLASIIACLPYEGVRIVIFSGRSEDHRGVVQKWLFDNGIEYDRLIMRKSGDQRRDSIVKSELFDEHVAPYYNFLAQLDDRDRVVNALRLKGIQVFQVARGDF